MPTLKKEDVNTNMWYLFDIDYGFVDSSFVKNQLAYHDEGRKWQRISAGAYASSDHTYHLLKGQVVLDWLESGDVREDPSNGSLFV